MLATSIVCYCRVLTIVSKPAIEDGSKARVLCAQETRVSQQTTKCTIYSKLIGNVDSSIKLRNFYSTSPSFWLGVCKHKVFLGIHAWGASNMHLERQNTTKALGNRCPFTKGHHKDRQGYYNDEFRSAMHHTIT